MITYPSWRLGYYKGVNREDWDDYCAGGKPYGDGKNDPNWTWTQHRFGDVTKANRETVLAALRDSVPPGIVWAILEDPILEDPSI